MKKIYIALAVLATALLVSCVKERSFEKLTPLDENDIAFILNGMSTKSAEFSPAAVTGITIPLGRTESGEGFSLEETIEELNPNPGTKGAPAYTVNVGEVYSTMGVFAFTEDVTYEKMDDAAIEGKGWRYRYNYGYNPWPESSAEDFYLIMPATPNGTFAFTKRESQETKFTYESPAKAVDQQDILVGQTSLTKAEHDTYFDKGGAPVTMYHALSGIKFRSGWDNANNTKTIITGVKWHGLKSKGTCTFNPAATDMISWSLGTDTTSFSQGFKDETWSSTKDGTVNYNSSDKKFGDSWYQAGNDSNNPTNTHNLNNEDGEWTFWFIPQEMNDDGTLEVTFKVKINATQGANAKEVTHKIKIGKQLAAKNVEWKAGQLRTYTLKPIHVAVEIEDSMDAQKWTKSDVVIENVGNVSMFVRVNIIANWVGERQNSGASDDWSDETVLMGYTDNTMTTEVARWGDKEFVWSGSNKDYGTWTSATGTTYAYSPFGTFVGLPEKGDKTGPGDPVYDTTNNPENKKFWIRHDKYYYYSMAIGPEEMIDPETSPLFESYTVNTTPVIWIADHTGTPRQARNVHLQMDVIVQAISADGYGPYDYIEAWTAALNPDNDPDFNFNDL